MKNVKLSSAQIQVIEILAKPLNHGYEIRRSAWRGKNWHEIEDGHSRHVRYISGATVEALIRMGVLVRVNSDGVYKRYGLHPNTKESWSRVTTK